MSQVMTILEAHVAPEQAAALEQAYNKTISAEGRAGSEPVQSFLIRSTDDATLWRILSVWSSREALLKMRSTTPVPLGIQIFRAAGVTPAFTLFTIEDGFRD